MPRMKQELCLTVAKGWPDACKQRGMATRITWSEMLAVMTDAEVRERDAITLESYRWQLLEASARLSTTRLIIDQPSPVLDATEAALLQPLEAGADPLARLIADLGQGEKRVQAKG